MFSLVCLLFPFRIGSIPNKQSQNRLREESSSKTQIDFRLARQLTRLPTRKWGSASGWWQLPWGPRSPAVLLRGQRALRGGSPGSGSKVWGCFTSMAPDGKVSLALSYLWDGVTATRLGEQRWSLVLPTATGPVEESSLSGISSSF